MSDTVDLKAKAKELAETLQLDEAVANLRGVIVIDDDVQTLVRETITALVARVEELERENLTLRDERDKGWQQRNAALNRVARVEASYDAKTFTLASRTTELDKLKVRVEELEREEKEHEELEARLCPEDVGFEEFIAYLRQRLATAEAEARTKDWTITQLRTALENWGHHFGWCDVRKFEGSESINKCNCGYIAALETGYEVGAGFESLPVAALPISAKALGPERET